MKNIVIRCTQLIIWIVVFWLGATRRCIWLEWLNMKGPNFLRKYYLTDLRVFGVAQFGPPIFAVFLPIIGVLTILILVFPKCQRIKTIRLVCMGISLVAIWVPFIFGFIKSNTVLLWILCLTSISMVPEFLWVLKDKKMQRISLILALAICLFSGCGKSEIPISGNDRMKDTVFPANSDGYPDDNYAVINGEKCKLKGIHIGWSEMKTSVSVNEEGELDILLVDGYEGCSWTMDPGSDASVKSYMCISPDVKPRYGESSGIERFLIVPKDNDKKEKVVKMRLRNHIYNLVEYELLIKIV